MELEQFSLKNDDSDVRREEKLSHFLWRPIMDKNTIGALFHGRTAEEQAHSEFSDRGFP